MYYHSQKIGATSTQVHKQTRPMWNRQDIFWMNRSHSLVIEDSQLKEKIGLFVNRFQLCRTYAGDHCDYTLLKSQCYTVLNWDAESGAYKLENEVSGYLKVKSDRTSSHVLVDIIALVLQDCT